MTDGSQVIVDAQLLQSSDRKRGMGLFLQSLLANIVALSDQSNLKWAFILNSKLPDLPPEDKLLIQKLNGREVILDLLHKGDCEFFNQASQLNRAKIDKALAGMPLSTSKNKTVFFIPAMFSNDIYPVFPSSGTSNIMLFHDLIPYLYHRNYFPSHESDARKDYAQRFREFYKTDLFVTNSQTTADDLTIYFGVDPTRIAPILGAGADREGMKPVKPKALNILETGYVLMPSGDDFRKNNVAAAQAFNSSDINLKLVVTSNFSDGSKKLLQEICPNIIFTGAVSEQEYLWLVDNSKLVFFPTEYEGLGMPLLEAVDRDATILCSNIPVFSEISQDAFFYCDPKSVSDMKQALDTVLKADSKIVAEKKSYYKDILKNFSWKKTANAFIKAVENSRVTYERKKLALFCPSPSSYSAVGKFAFNLHAELSQLFDVDYFIEEGETKLDPSRPNILEYASNYFPATSFNPKEAKSYDYILYNIGNSEFHTETILNSLRLSANTIIHDTRLNGIFDFMTNRHLITEERRRYEELIDEMMKNQNTSFLTSIVTNQLDVFCHSDFAENAIMDLTKGTKTRVHKAMLPVGVPVIELPKNSKSTISFAGIIAEDKGIGLIKEVSQMPGVDVKIFGFGVLGSSPLLDNLGDNVSISKDLSDKEFQDNLRHSDVLVNYRLNYHGETSLSTLEAMRYGVAVVVRDVGWFSELPDDTVVKVANEYEVAKAIKALLNNPSMRLRIAKAARQFLQENYSFSNYAKLLSEGMR